VDCELLVNWQRLVKSTAEIEMLQQAATIAGVAMQTAYDAAKPGVRQNDLMAEVVAAQIRGTSEYGGDMTALHPLVLAGEAASTAHPMWTDAVFEKDQTIAFELGGCRKRYNAGLARTVHLGRPPQKLTSTAEAVNEGMEAVLNSMKSGVPCCDVDHHLLPENAVVHIILGMWMDGWGMELSETIHVRENDAVCLTDFPREVAVIK